jgi:hypothetical protein
MRKFLAACVVLGVAIPVTADEVKKEQVEKDLRLDVRLLRPKKIEPGVAVPLRMELVNTSKERTYAVVKPGDGSEVGLRTPHVFYTATVTRTDGETHPVPKAEYGRCGQFDRDRTKDIVALKPGEKLPLWRWLRPPDKMLELQEAGEVRLVVHYSCRAVREGAPAFEVVSAPVVFEVVRPLEVVLKVRKPLQTRVQTRLSELFDVTLVNRSNDPVEVKSPTDSGDARLRFEIGGEFAGWRPMIGKKQAAVTRALKPGEAAALLGAGELANGFDGTWTYPVADTVRVRAVYHRSTWKPASVIKSEWVKIRVVGDAPAGQSEDGPPN